VHWEYCVVIIPGLCHWLIIRLPTITKAKATTTTTTITEGTDYYEANNK